MSNWFKRFFEKEEELYEELPKQREQIQKRDKLQARMTFQYPQGHFRFPVIPDQPAEEQAPLYENDNEDKARSFQQRSTDTHSIQSTTERKTPFTPTDVPSPVYGFNERKPSLEESQPTDEIVPFPSARRRKQLTEEANKATSVQEKHVLVESRHIQETSQSDHEFTDALEEENEKEEEQINIAAAPFTEDSCKRNAAAAAEPCEEMVIEEKEQEHKQEQQQQEQQRVQEQVQRHEQKQVQEQVQERTMSHAVAKEQGIEKPKPKTEESSVVPFNVVMLKRDRQRLKNKEARAYQYPSLQLLHIPQAKSDLEKEWVAECSQTLNETLANFNVNATVVDSVQGPTVTRFELQPSPGVKVNKITNLQDDIKLSLAAKDIRIEAPIPGKSTIGIEVPNRTARAVMIREILRSPQFLKHPSPLAVALGLDIEGIPIVTDLHRMPHGLIAGATGSGKSVCINAILMSLLYKATPDEVRLLLIDPKMVELAPYNGVPHLVSPVITDVKAATAALKWAVEEMEERYTAFADNGVRDIARYNEKFAGRKPKMPYIVIVIDELADLMMAAPQDVEEAIARLAQKARACGIHLLVATQRPSVDVITGLIKANIPTRIAFSVSSQTDSRTILDASGAEKLLGRGDMLFLENGSSKPSRLQGLFVADDEIDAVVSHVKKQGEPEYLFNQAELMEKTAAMDVEDELFEEACYYVLEQNSASTSGLQRRFRIGYNRAARLIDMMEEKGIISGNKGSKPRDLLISKEQLESVIQTS
ncbi:DNA translocase FtsK [Bacillaceae bacterium SIJ1]|uniref:DNA translocase FtsK n=1 Tax=Litoribacterium kuwaitense TaxID=1398745 RepID=UPI0013EB2263|nr:DNA translocase FtsK [Litoribacterium kuwaitense]NGP44204.1 DNA translocase FtsK [Litoribacterium kuwaitense]